MPRWPKIIIKRTELNCEPEDLGKHITKSENACKEICLWLPTFAQGIGGSERTSSQPAQPFELNNS
jgi:hypothetical protein